jgi:regulator of protease activity HflC (stomatin/prohibitin superfamily)
MLLPLIPLLLVFVVIFLVSSVKVLYQYERAVIFTLGRYSHTSGPGLIIVIPGLQRMIRIDMRVVVEEVRPQDVISRDNVTVRVSAILYYQVTNPERCVNQVMNFSNATSQLAQTTLRSVLGKHELDDMLADRDKLNRDIQSIIDQQTESWGIKVSNVEIKNIDLDETMIRAMAKQAEAERMRRAKIINSEGEFQSAQKLVEAGDTLMKSPAAMELRYLNTLQDMSNQDGKTIILPMPMGLLNRLFDKS